MIPELGEYALILACIFTFIAIASPLLVPFRGVHYASNIIIKSVIIQTALIALAFAVLIYVFAVSDFSVALVYLHSHQLKPLIYKITATWGNHEGSILLWVFAFAVINVVFIKYSNFSWEEKAGIALIQSVILFGFLLFIIITSDPFTRILQPPDHGLGLNPLLQDIGLAIHPPILYLGYASASICFSISIVALIKGHLHTRWSANMRPWTLISWVFLSMGIGLGSWWAYRELGWGGFWFWDPVENLSLMPWLVNTALLHAVIACEKRSVFKAWVVLLSICAFCLSLLGTFLVRSGVLTSVHSFANDPARGVFILILLFLITVTSLVIFAIRGHKLLSERIYHLSSREGFMLFNTILFCSGCFIIVWGTLFPIFYQAIMGKQITVAGPYFTKTFVPLVIPVLVLSAASPYIPWGQAKLKGSVSAWVSALVLSFLATYLLYYFLDIHSVMSLLIFNLAVFLIIMTIMLFLMKINITAGLDKAWRNARSLPATFYGMCIAHTAFALIAAVIVVLSQAQKEDDFIMKKGDKIHFHGYDITLKKIDYGHGKNYLLKKAKLYVETDGNELTTLNPEIRFYPVELTKTVESSIWHHWWSDLYTVIGDTDHSSQNVTVKIYYKPMIGWLWSGIALLAIGGLVSIYGVVLRKNRICV